jgi:hypothetical protein
LVALPGSEAYPCMSLGVFFVHSSHVLQPFSDHWLVRGAFRWVRSALVDSHTLRVICMSQEVHGH